MSRLPRALVLTLAAALGLTLALVNMALFEANRVLQLEVNARAQYIQQTVQLEGLNREIVGAIAQLAVRDNDDALRTMLTQHGITVTASARPSPPGTQGTPATPAARRGMLP